MTNLAEEYFNQRVNEEVERRTELKNYKSHIVDIFQQIHEETQNAYKYYQDYKEQGLNVNSIEAEGAYRALLTLHNYLVSYYIPDELRDEMRNVYHIDVIEGTDWV